MLARTLVGFLLLTFGLPTCKYFSRLPKYDSETADARPVQTVDRGDIFLNNEANGTLEDLSVIKIRVCEIMKLRAANGVFEEGTNEVAGRINVFPTETISIGKLGELFQLLKSCGAMPLLPKRSASSLTFDDVPEKPNPLQLLLNIGKKSGLPSFEEHRDLAYFSSPLLQLDYRDTMKYNFSPEFIPAEELLEITLARLSGKSIEIATDDSFFANERAESNLDGTDQYTEVPQIKISEQQLREKLQDTLKYSRVRDKLFLIASDKASTRALLQVLEAADPFAKGFTIVVRPANFIKH